MPDIIAAIGARGDIGHLALAAWALAASGFALALLARLDDARRDAVQSAKRFDAFVRELARFNRRAAGTSAPPTP